MNSPEKNYPKITPNTIHLRKKSVVIHENAHKCLKELSARALFAPNRISEYGNEFPIINNPKMTPMNSYLKKKCKFHIKKVPKSPCVRAHFLHSIVFLSSKINSPEKK